MSCGFEYYVLSYINKYLNVGAHMFKLISDTSCDWIKEYAEEHNVTLVPLYTTFDGQTYYKEQFEIQL